MSHNKQTNSQCTIPFSWETIPGVPKYMTSPKDAGGLHKEVISQKAHSPTPPLPPPLPPAVCFRDPVMKRSVSSIFWREEDPFLVAMKECSKDSNKVKSDNKMKFGIWGTKSFLWCRCSFDVEEGNLVRKRPLPSRVGSMVHQQYAHGLIRRHKGSRKWNT